MSTPRDDFIHALERKPPRGRVPHFELVFFLTMEAFGTVHPSQRHYGQWDQMEEKERRLHREDIARVFVRTAERYEHSAIFVHPSVGGVDEACWLLDEIREQSGDRYFTMMHGDPTFAIPNGDQMVDFSYRMADDPQGLRDEAERRLEASIERARLLRERTSLDGFALCSDYCFNSGPFLSPAQLEQFVFPYLARGIAAYRELGYYTIKHTDGNIMPILDQLVAAGPHALHSLDPQGGVDLGEVKRRVGNRVCLIGNVDCSLLDTGTDAEYEADTRRALAQGMPGGGYIFSTSNCVYTGMPLARYERIVDIWKQEGVYPHAAG